MLTVQSAGPTLRAVIESRSAPLDLQIEATVDHIWQTETARAPGLFDGPLFSVRSIEPGLIRGEMVSYRRFIAHRRQPELAAAMGIRPLGVTGLHLCRDGIVFCRRAEDVEMDKARWELSPAGSVDGQFTTPDGAIDLAAQIVEELAQETGVGGELLSEVPRPFSLVEDDESHVIDIGMLVRSDLDAAAIRARFAGRQTKEYDKVAIVSRSDLEAFIGDVDLAPVSRALLRAGAALL